MSGGSVVLLEGQPTTDGRDSTVTAIRLEEQATRGIDDSFEAMVSRYQERVFRLVSGVLGPRFASDAEDATQEVFLQAYVKMSGFRGESRFATWLYRLAYNRSIDYRRRLMRIHTPLAESDADSRPQPAPKDDPFRSTSLNEQARSLQARLAELSEPQRLAVYLRYWQGCSIDEIAELTTSKSATVKSHLFRARRRLARSIEEAAE